MLVVVIDFATESNDREICVNTWWKWIGTRASLLIAIYMLSVMASQWGLTGSSSEVPLYALIIAVCGVLGISGIVSEIKNHQHR